MQKGKRKDFLMNALLVDLTFGKKHVLENIQAKFQLGAQFYLQLTQAI
jgi:hypothetical protein